jgi:NADH-quinone oxidoreductase subunit M
MFGKPPEIQQEIPDLDSREILLLSPLVVMIFWIGIYPATFLKIAEPALMKILGN